MNFEEEFAKYKANIGSSSKFTEYAIPCSIFSNYVEVPFGETTKCISITDFIDALVINVENATTDPIPYTLPESCFAVNIVTGGIYINCYYPGERVILKHFGEEYSIPGPNFVLYFSLIPAAADPGAWQISVVKYFITDRTKTELISAGTFFRSVSDTDRILQVPYPNFYNTGSMCYGKNSVPSLFRKKLQGLDYFYRIIYNSPFNDDLGIKGTKYNWRPTNWFKHLAALTAFPYEEMK